MAAPRILRECHCCVLAPTGLSRKSATSGPRADVRSPVPVLLQVLRPPPYQAEACVAGGPSSVGFHAGTDLADDPVAQILAGGARGGGAGGSPGRCGPAFR